MAMSDVVRAVVFISIFVFQVQVLDLVVLEKVLALHAFVQLVDSLRLRALNVVRCQREIRRHIVHVLAEVSDEMRRAHQVVLALGHARWGH